MRLGAKAKAEQCPGIEGIKTEHDEFFSEHDPDLRSPTCSLPVPAPARSTTR